MGDAPDEPDTAGVTDGGATPADLGIPADPVEPALSVAAVARRLGIAPATLRTWDRRYGVGPSGHATGRHRRYDSRDVARLELMQRALLRGASPAEAARYALTTMLVPHQQTSDDRTPPGPPDPMPAAGPILAEGGVPAARSSGEVRVLRLPGAGRLAKGLARAALAMDSVAAQRILAEAMAENGVPYAWDEVIRPVLGALAQRWTHSGTAVEIEHLLYESVQAALIRATPLLTVPRNPRPVLLACAPGERHTLALYGLVAALAWRGVGTRMFGSALPADALGAAIRRVGPAAVVVWAQLPRYADPALLTGLPKGRQRSRLYLGGPGWRILDLDPRLSLPDGLGPAADEIEHAVL